jgi:tripartite-type tricarboxylate transporter receptor subunit TctC
MPVVGGASVKLPRRKFLHLAAGTATLPIVPRIASALDYPTRPVRIIVGFPPGGAADIAARLTAQWLSQRLHQQFIVENRPGAASNIAAETVVRADADGYTLLLVTTTNAINATLYDHLSFNFVRDLALVAGIVRVPNAMVINPSVPVDTVPAFIAYAKANPGKINMASGGVGTPVHVAGELFKAMCGINLVHVPYHGDAPALVDLVGGQVQVMFDLLSASIGFIRSGKLRALAVTTATRSDALPNVPTIGEFVPGYEASSWEALAAPRDTPGKIIGRLNDEINAAFADTTFIARLADFGGVPLAGSPSDFGKFFAEETEKWAKIIRIANIKVE